MSWDLRLTKDGVTVCADNPHNIRGGTYCVNENCRLELNITYNYGEVFALLWRGVPFARVFNGVEASESIKIIDAALCFFLECHNDYDYWYPTLGNVKRALENMRELATLAPPDATWEVK